MCLRPPQLLFMLLLSITIVCFYLSNGFLLLWSFLSWERCLCLHYHRNTKDPFSFCQGANVENILLSHLGVVTDLETTSQFSISFPKWNTTYPLLCSASNSNGLQPLWLLHGRLKKEGAALLICGLEACTIYVSPIDIKYDRLKSEPPKMCTADDKLPSNFERIWIMAQSARERHTMKARRPTRSLHN